MARLTEETTPTATGPYNPSQIIPPGVVLNISTFPVLILSVIIFSQIANGEQNILVKYYWGVGEERSHQANCLGLGFLHLYVICREHAVTMRD